MKTQIVYVVVSSENDVFLEELWVSVWSLRYYHPEAVVNVLVDKLTGERVKNHPVKELVNEIIVVDTPQEATPMKRSRIIKTSIRNIIEGDFLFIDTDTIICNKLDGVDAFTCDICAVPDGHQSIKEAGHMPIWINKVKEVYGVDISDDGYYYNSGVMYVADNDLTRRFYSEWHDNWKKYSIDGVRNADQPALSVTNHRFGRIIRTMHDCYNCQLGISAKYLHESFIVHCIHMNFIEDQSFFPFFGGSIYRKLKDASEITADIANEILNCKSAWHVRCQMVGPDQIGVLWSPTGQAYTIMVKSSPNIRKIFDWFALKYIRYTRMKKKLKKLFH